ncbi:MAG: hypothetical protein QME68_05160, partial [Elusimicrobiota bacterium]|nr:hypothetical protein [Elusimicrobiota bacterium]
MKKNLTTNYLRLRGTRKGGSHEVGRSRDPTRLRRAKSLQTNFIGLKFKNPVFLASGVGGVCGEEYSE